MKTYYIYIMASKKNGVLYIGVTSNLLKRVFEHRKGFVDGFTKRYWVKYLVYFEQTESIESAISREKQLKTWKRDWKVKLIEGNNPTWRDLYKEIE